MTRYRTRRSARTLLALLIGISGPVWADGNTLADALEAALTRADATKQDTLPDSGEWLAAMPTFTASYYDSRKNQGTDEAEFILTLPFKSATRRRLDQGLGDLDLRLDEASAAYRRWAYSGLVRERAWAHRLADLRLGSAAEKRDLLTGLSTRIARLADRGAVPKYRSLIVQRALLEAELEAATRASERAAEQAAFRALTGWDRPPPELVEAGDVPAEPDYARHPALQRLELAREQERQLLTLAAPEVANWNLGLVARNFDGPQFTDRQLGLILELPLGFTDVRNAGNLSAQRSAGLAYLLERDRLQLALRSDWEALRAEAELLRRRQELLTDAERLAGQIQAQLEALSANNELEAEILLQRMLDVLDTRAEARLTDALLGRNAARLR